MRLSHADTATHSVLLEHARQLDAARSQLAEEQAEHDERLQTFMRGCAERYGWTPGTVLNADGTFTIGEAQAAE